VNLGSLEGKLDRQCQQEDIEVTTSQLKSNEKKGNDYKNGIYYISVFIFVAST
jgi:hypothetical protein